MDLLLSTEFRTDLIQSLYMQILGRPADATELEEVRYELDACCFVRRQRPTARGMDEAALSHRPVPRGDGLSWEVPTEPPVYRSVRVRLGPMAIRALAVRQII